VVTPVNPVDPDPTSPAIDVSTNLLTIFTRNFAQSFGVYDDGHLEKPDSMPLLGQGFLKIFQERNRGYGSLDLLSVVQSAAKEIHRDIPAAEALQIGDITAKAGGPLGGHGSHQNGLDVDLVYFKKDHRVMPTTGSTPGATGFDEDFVDAKGNVVPNFDIDANWAFIQVLVATNRIDRIFADQHIKREFCRYAVAKGLRQEWSETLRKLRHWPNHQDHMHVRLTCPPNSKKCKPIPAIPAGDGCDNLLDRAGSDGGGFLRMEGELRTPLDLGQTLDEHGC
jgi:penicillin-insensitive murein endopeptidase